MWKKAMSSTVHNELFLTDKVRWNDLWTIDDDTTKQESLRQLKYKNSVVQVAVIVISDIVLFLISLTNSIIFSNLFFNHLLLWLQRTVYQDMSLPLSAYYMASSHNTYLEGDQLTSASSANRYGIILQSVGVWLAQGSIKS